MISPKTKKLLSLTMTVLITLGLVQGKELIYSVPAYAAEDIGESEKDSNFNKDVDKTEITKINSEHQNYNLTTDSEVKIDEEISNDSDGDKQFKNYSDSQERQISIVAFSQPDVQEKANAECFITGDDGNGGLIIKRYEESNNTSEDKTNIVVPEKIVVSGQEKKVTGIGNGAFYDCSGLKSISLPEGITSIGEEAFYNCSGLKSISLPEGITSIGEEAFSNCSGLKSISLPKEVANIGNGAFYNCSGLENIRLPKITNAGSGIFSNCSGLKSISFSEGVTSIGNGAFSNCSGLESVTLPEGITSIEAGAFFYCSGLKIISFPEAITNIDDSAFINCSGLTNMIIPSDLANNDKIKNLDSECKIIYKVSDDSKSVEIVNVKVKDTDSIIIIPGKIYDKTVSIISDSVISNVTNSTNNIESDRREICRYLEKKGIKTDRITLTNNQSDKNTLRGLYDKCIQASYDSCEFTESSYTAYKNALNTAKNILDDKFSYQDEIDEALDNLQKSVDELSKVDKSELLNVYEKYKLIAKGNYTEESYNKFTEALKNAENVINDVNAIQSKINEAAKNLQSAADKLEIKKSSGSSSSSKNNSSSSSNDGNGSIKDNSENDNKKNEESSWKIGWNVIDGKMYFILSDGNYCKGWYHDSTNGKWYMLDRITGAMVTGWFRDLDGKWYMLDRTTGAMVTGWFRDLDGKWYMLDRTTGAMVTGWFRDLDGKWYFLNLKSGEMKYGWMHDSTGKWYHFGTTGAMSIGWFKDTNGKWYYLYQDGSMAIDTYINGYYVNKNGEWI